MKSCLVFTLALGLPVSFALAQDRPNLTNDGERMSYALGASIAAKLKRQGAEIDIKALAAGMADMRAGKPVLTPDQEKTALRDLKHDIQAKADAQRTIAGAKNLKTGLAFLAANAQKKGVTVIECVAPDGAKAQVQYEILESGSGPTPQKTDILRLHYEGRLLDGTVFDSSWQRGTPWTGRANDFIAGWIEPLQRMKVGDKWRLFIPPSLGYGEFVPYGIGPDSTLIYDIKLLGIEKPSGTTN